jgi:hypothetical protein
VNNPKVINGKGHNQFLTGLGEGTFTRQISERVFKIVFFSEEKSELEIGLDA